MLKALVTAPVELVTGAELNGVCPNEGFVVTWIVLNRVDMMNWLEIDT